MRPNKRLHYTIFTCILSSFVVLPTDHISFDMIIRCSSSNSDVIATTVLINVTTVTRWQHLYCKPVNDSQLSVKDAAPSLCFAESLANFNIYENTISILGRVAPPAYVEMCPGYDSFQRNYRILTEGKLPSSFTLSIKTKPVDVMFHALFNNSPFIFT